MVKNNRLHHVGYLWAFSSLRSSPGAQAHYRHRRDVGDWHAQAQRHLFNRLFDEEHAFKQPATSLVAAAA
jgi:hypothetical protein